MRKLWLLLPLLALLGCPGAVEQTTEYEPVFMQRSVLENSVELGPPRPLKTPGKIYYKDDLLLINERYVGVHLIDNSNPEKPTPLNFLAVPGCVDMAIKGSVLYVDNAVDLLAFDLTKRQLVKRLRNVFPEPLPPDLGFIPNEYQQGLRPQNDLILVGWEKPE